MGFLIITKNNKEDKTVIEATSNSANSSELGNRK